MMMDVSRSRRRALTVMSAAVGLAALPGMPAFLSKPARSDTPARKVVGEMRRYRIRPDDTLVDIARTERLGFVERSEEHTSELQSRGHLVCRLLLEKKTINMMVPN